jgi:hypothetical protein
MPRQAASHRQKIVHLPTPIHLHFVIEEISVFSLSTIQFFTLPFSFLMWRLLLISAAPRPSSDLTSVAHALCHRTSHVTRHTSLAFLLMRARTMMRSVMHAWQHQHRAKKRVAAWVRAGRAKMAKKLFDSWLKLFARHSPSIRTSNPKSFFA